MSREKSYPCKRCGGKLKDIPHCFDSDGIRHAGRCVECRTVFASYAHGYTEIGEFDYDDLRDGDGDTLPPQHILDQHRARMVNTANKYIKDTELYKACKEFFDSMRATLNAPVEETFTSHSEYLDAMNVYTDRYRAAFKALGGMVDK